MDISPPTTTVAAPRVREGVIPPTVILVLEAALALLGLLAYRKHDSKC